MTITIYSDLLNTRIRYITDFVCTQLLGAEVLLTDEITDFQQAPEPRICYTEKPVTFRSLFIPRHPIMLETGMTVHSPEVKMFDGKPAFFFVTGSHLDYPFDLFALCFYMISRYEEYQPFDSDRHGRFPTSLSLAARNSFLHIPLVDIWASHLATRLTFMFPAFSPDKPKYHFQTSYDIDMAWAYCNKGLLRSLGAIARDILHVDSGSLSQRFRVFIGKETDPFDNFEYMDQLNWKFGLMPLYFFQLGTNSEFDKNNSPDHPAMHRLIQQVHQQYKVGLHPSYLSNSNTELLNTEKAMLESIIDETVTISRQHFVKLTFPHTYRQLLNCGFVEDYTMGFADRCGFRAGTSTPFYWYDLKGDEISHLLVHPFQLMDVTLQGYLKLSPEAAVEQINEIVAQVKRYGGMLVSIWHNSSLSEQQEWYGWRKVYEHLLETACSETEDRKM